MIVDPGVGGSRAIIAIEMAGHIFLAPDNGILTLLFEEGNIAEIIRVDNKKNIWGQTLIIIIRKSETRCSS